MGSRSEAERTIPVFILTPPNNLETLSTLEGRREYLKNCFRDYLNKLRDKQEVSLDVFLMGIQLQMKNIKEDAEKQLEDLEGDDKNEIFNWIDEFETRILPADYDALKGLLFEALDKGLLEQKYKDNANQLYMVATRG